MMMGVIALRVDHRNRAKNLAHIDDPGALMSSNTCPNVIGKKTTPLFRNDGACNK